VVKVAANLKVLGLNRLYIQLKKVLE